MRLVAEEGAIDSGLLTQERPDGRRSNNGRLMRHPKRCGNLRLAAMIHGRRLVLSTRWQQLSSSPLRQTKVEGTGLGHGLDPPAMPNVLACML